MISVQEIAKQYAPKEQVFKRHILREYLQYKILQIIFDSAYSNKLCFLGGTALRIVYGNNRFSEDLDFDNLGISTADFDKLSDVVKKELEMDGYEVSVRTVFKGAYRCYVKMPKLLYDNNLSGQVEEKILIQIDTAPHGFSYIPDRKILNKFDVFTEIFTTPLDILLAQKVYAVFNRKRAKGRDFYDIVFLQSLVKEPNYDYLELKLDIKNKDDLKEKVLEKCKDLDFKFLAKDVAPFLINSNETKRVLMFCDFVKAW